MEYIKTKYEEYVTCNGIEIEPDSFSGCDTGRGSDCPVCYGGDRIIYCPRCGENRIVISNGVIACLSCGFDVDLRNGAIMSITDELGTISIEALMMNQAPIPGGWVCPTCVNYKGKIICGKGVMICFKGANMGECLHFKKGKICVHCGKAT